MNKEYISNCFYLRSERHQLVFFLLNDKKLQFNLITLACIRSLLLMTDID